VRGFNETKATVLRVPCGCAEPLLVEVTGHGSTAGVTVGVSVSRRQGSRTPETVTPGRYVRTTERRLQARRAELVETIQQEMTAMAESKRGLWAEHPRWEGQPRCHECGQPLITPSSQEIGVCLRCRPADDRPLEANYGGYHER
jgi:hypothetical protein